MTNLNTPGNTAHHSTRARPASPTEDRFWSKVNKTEGCWEWLAAKQPRGYGVFRLGPDEGSKNILAHRYSHRLHYGMPLDGLDVDHLCHNCSCVNPEHLRAVTHKVNSENRKGPNANNNASGIRGVYPIRDKWKVSIRHDGKMLYFGLYATLAEAEAVAIQERARLFTAAEPEKGAA